MATVQSGGQTLPATFSNHFLAHLQVATAKRFGQGKGFFLTVTQAGDGAAERTVSHWLHPAVPVSFCYDVSDDEGERIAPVSLDDNEVDTLVEAMDQPTGVRGSDAVWWPFGEGL